MKKLLLIAALASMSAPAYASKARVTALGNAAHLVDTQTVFDNPAHLNLMGDYVTFEAGPSTAASSAAQIVSGTYTYAELANVNNPNAEGGFVRSAGDAKYMFYLGRKSPFTNTFRTSLGFLPQENPIEVQYAMKGDVNWGVGFNYSNSDKKSSGQKQNAQGIRLGASAQAWEAYATIGLGAKATGAGAGLLVTGDANGDGIINAGEFTALPADATAEMKSTTGFKVGGEYNMENIVLHGSFSQDGFDYTTANVALNNLEVRAQAIEVGAVDHNKLEGGQWFYGVSYQMTEVKQSNANIDKKTNSSYLPFLVGVEYDAASWLTLRASATQNVLIGTTKTDDGPGAFVDEADTIANNTEVATGLGLRFNKWVLDGSWAAQTTGNINTTNFVTNLGLTYMF